MADAKAAADVLSALTLCGLMGFVGQGARTIVGLKKFSDAQADDPTQSDSFIASRIFVGLMIGFIAGVIAGLALNVLDTAAFNGQLLMGLAAAGYAGTDVIEAFAQKLGAAKQPQFKVPSLPNVDYSVSAAQPPAKVQPSIVGHAKELAAAQGFAPAIQAAAKKYGLDEELIYAIASRESAWGLTLRPPGPAGTGDWAPRKGPEPMPPDSLGWGRGLMQIDYGAFEFARTGDWADASANIDFGCNLLAENLVYFKKIAGDDDPLRAGIAAYNCGRGNVSKALALGGDVDLYTTGHNYSSDVLARAQWFKQHISPVS